MIKSEIRTVVRNHLHYVVQKGNTRRFKPWLGDCFAFLYDFVMEHSIFPRKFGGDISKHQEILSKELKDIHGERVLELATGSGSAARFLPPSNQYTGTDISPGLLRRAVKNFAAAGFKDGEFFVTSAEQLPFEDDSFSTCLCILSLNFFDDIEKVFRETRRVLVQGGLFVCSVPVPERIGGRSTVRGKLFAETELERICRDHGFCYASLPYENGALLYFKATLQKCKSV